MKLTLEFVQNMAIQAGEIIQSFAVSDLNIQNKSVKDLVTQADYESERFLINTILKNFSNHSIVAEESGKRIGDAEHQWFIDPLDGTLNFAHSVPIYSVSIGYAFEGEMKLGVIYDPSRKELFSAQLGCEAALNGQPIRVSNRRGLIECLLGTGFPDDADQPYGDNIANFVYLNQAAQAVRRFGSSALALAYLAAGRLDGYWDIGTQQWDIAAASLIVREAGGVVTDIYGGQEYLKNPPSIIAGSPNIHEEILVGIQSVMG